MKKFTKILIVGLTLFSLNSFSQNFAPIGAEWHFEIRHSESGNIDYSKWNSVSDSIILGKSTRKVEHTFGINGSLIETFMFVYEDSGVVYKYHSPSNSFTILYNFNANTNDSWLMDNDTCSLLITVDSTSMININSFNLKVLYVSTFDGFSGMIIERIGHHIRPLPHISFSCYNIQVDASYYYGLRCYSDSIFGNYTTGISSLCDSTFVGIGENKLNNLSISIHPNPTNSTFNIEFKTPNQFIKSNLQIFDLTGKEVFTQQLTVATTQIDVTGYPKGIYFYRITNKKGQSSGKIVIE